MNPVTSCAKRVIFTCIVGDYDELRQPQCEEDEDWLFVCFRDSNSFVGDTEGRWHVLKVEPFLPQACLDEHDVRRKSTLICRFIKFFGWTLFPSATQSIWIDGVFTLIQKPTLFFNERVKEDVDLVVHRHPRRSCAFDEADVCCTAFPEQASCIRTQMSRYDKTVGLAATGVLMRQHGDEPQVKRLRDAMEVWWQEVIAHSNRDQLSFMFAMTNSVVKWSFAEPMHVRTHSVSYAQHMRTHKQTK